MANYARGAKVEYHVRDLYKSKGYFVMRSAGSRGAFDLLAYDKYNVIFIQCKNHKPTKVELADFHRAVIPDFCRKELWFKPCRGKVEVHK